MTAEAIRLLKLARGSIIIQCPSCRQPIPFSETQHLIEETIRTLDGEADAKRDARLKELRATIENDRKRRWKVKPSDKQMKELGGSEAWAKQMLIEDLEDQRILGLIDVLDATADADTGRRQD